MKCVISRDEIKEVEKKFVVEDEELNYEGKKPRNTREAFAISLAKWTILRRESKNGNYVFDGNVHTCGLCIKFMNEEPDWEGNVCNRCPVFKEIGKDQCRGTPYYDYRDDNDTDVRSVAAESELKFLIGLANKTLAKE